MSALDGARNGGNTRPMISRNSASWLWRPIKEWVAG